MAEWRRDHLQRTWVIMAPGRDRRPRDTIVASTAGDPTACPFCPGQEHQTPPEILATGRGPDQPADGPGWRVRVVPNRYPALADLTSRHEVIIATADHRRQLADLTPSAAAEFLTVVQSRWRRLMAEPGVGHVQFFLNAGASAGASLSHLHAQLLTLPEAPPNHAIRAAALAEASGAEGGCLICAEAQAADRDQRAILSDPLVQASCPRASHVPWEVRLYPAQHQASFGVADQALLSAMATALVTVAAALREAASDPAYNVVLHSAMRTSGTFHWHLDLIPRLTPLAGFELGTGCRINDLLPEEAARRLRGVLSAGTGRPER